MNDFTKEELLIILDDVNSGISRSGFAATRFYISISDKIQSLIDNYPEPQCPSAHEFYEKLVCEQCGKIEDI